MLCVRSLLSRRMAPNIQKTAAVSHVLLMLVLWSSSNTLRAVDGSFLEVRHKHVVEVE